MRPRTRWVCAALAAALGVAVLAACAAHDLDGGVRRDLMPEDVANQRIDEHVRDVAAFLGPRVRLEPSMRNALRNTSPFTGRPLRGTNIEADHLLVPTGGRVAPETLAADLERFWTARGYEVVDRPGAGPGVRTLRVRHPDDGVRLALRTNPAGTMWLSAGADALAA